MRVVVVVKNNNNNLERKRIIIYDCIFTTRSIIVMPIDLIIKEFILLTVTKIQKKYLAAATDFCWRQQTLGSQRITLKFEAKFIRSFSCITRVSSCAAFLFFLLKYDIQYCWEVLLDCQQYCVPHPHDGCASIYIIVCVTSVLHLLYIYIVLPYTLLFT